jgi:ubiquinone/menaquinone biosynthesis C-methylase UbiE
MTTTEFDPVRYKAAQRVNWNAISAGWATWQDEFERGAVTVTARLLELARVGPGSTVLDAGTGVGEPALHAAEVVGTYGRVLGIDIAPDMLSHACRRGAGVRNVEFAEGDLESLDLPARSFDAVLSRWGLMFAVDHVATFEGMLRILVPGGRLAAAVWGPPQGAPIMSLGFRAVSSLVDPPPPPPGSPSPFGMASADILAGELESAGFADVEISEFEVPFRFASPEQYIAFNRAVIPPALREVLHAELGGDDTADIRAALHAALEPYRLDDGGVALPSNALLVRAVAPGD